MSEHETLMDRFEQESNNGPAEFGQPEPAEPTPQSVAEQLNSLLLSADASARRIVHEAEARAREQLAQADQRIRSMEAEANRLASWSQQTEQTVQALSSAINEFRRDLEAIPQRISEALNPLASHVPVLVRQMEELMGALTAPTSNANAAAANAVVPDHSVEAGWAEGWNESGNGAS